MAILLSFSMLERKARNILQEKYPNSKIMCIFALMMPARQGIAIN